jgi:phosphoribosylaminoimidazolecarboxamide formyltransferase/IMP cyclohydrolase
MASVKIKSALISVYHKTGLDEIVKKLNELGVIIYSTGGTQTFIESINVPVKRVEDLTGYPSILGGRVKTLHPNVFGGILARREDNHLGELQKYEIPTFDLVIVDLYPFEETVKSTNDESEIIEKIDIGGISLIRAAAKNFNDVLVVSSQNDYGYLNDILTKEAGTCTLAQRKEMATRAFKVSSNYDTAIFNYFADDNTKDNHFKQSVHSSQSLRYGENPHQKGVYFGDLEEMLVKLTGKELSYNNLVDIDAAVNLMSEFKDDKPTFAILKHTNPCGIATRDTISEAWSAALEGDSISAFGGILISNAEIDVETAEMINNIFYEVLIAPSFSDDAIALLSKKKKRVLLKIKHFNILKKSFKSLLNGVIQQETDLKIEDKSELTVSTIASPSTSELTDLIFANKCAKHLKSNTIVLAKNLQLVGMGCGQTSRVDACRQAIEKANNFKLDLNGAVMASDAFFPFPDCVQLADEAGIKAVIQPGGSINDSLSIEYCNNSKMSMVMTGIRHFKH